MTTPIRAAARRTAPAKPTTAPPPAPVLRFTVGQYHRMGEAGILTENDRCELIDGLILEKPVINPPHAKSVRRLHRLLSAIFGGDDWVVGTQQPVTTRDSEPEPDAAVATGPEEKYDRRHPGPGETVLVAEVSDSSLNYDRGEKLQLYARARIPVYWILNLQDRRVEVYTDPRGGRNPTYRARTDYAPGAAVPVAVAGKTLGTIPVNELLP